MATATPDIDEIRRKMAQIRRELHEDVRGVVEGAEAATDWRRYVRNYPWATLGLALTVGYLVVPRRQRAATTIHLAQPTAAIPQAEPARLAVAEPEKKKGGGLLKAAFGLVAPMAFRAAQGYALQFAEQWLAQQMAQQFQAHPGLASAFGGQAGAPEPPRGPAARPPGTPRF